LACARYQPTLPRRARGAGSRRVPPAGPGPIRADVLLRPRLAPPAGELVLFRRLMPGQGLAVRESCFCFDRTASHLFFRKQV
jgi:hypothetical protein